MSSDKQEAPKEPTKRATAAAARKAAASKVTTANTQVSNLVKALIQKQTGQKPIAPTSSTLPFVSTGSVVVDFLIGGSPARDGKGPVCPGFPRRRITEVFGGESSGKTTLCLNAIAKVQQEGGIAMFLDFEQALHTGYAQTLGVSFDEAKLLFYQPETLEQGFQMLVAGIMAGVDLIVVDSVAAMIPAAELDKKVGENAKVGMLAKPMAENLPKFVAWLNKYPMDKATKSPIPGAKGTALVMINQTRATISTSGPGAGDAENTPGGKALKFYAYVRLKTTRIGSEYIEKKDPLTGKVRRYPYGNQTKVKCIKSKVDAKQGHEVELFIRYGWGIDNYYSVIQTGQATGVIRKDGTWLTYGSERFQGRDKFRVYLMENPRVYEELAKKINDAVLSTAEAAVEEDELSEEELLMAEMNRELGGGAEGEEDEGEIEETEISGEEAESVTVG